MMFLPLLKPRTKISLLLLCVFFLTTIPLSFAISNFCAEGSVIGCDGVCGSTAKFDKCGVCNGFNKDMDECGVCFGKNKDKDECGVCFGRNKDKDDCGVCLGKNALKGCDGVCRSGKKLDDCGVCEGKNAAKGCDNRCHSGVVDKGCGCGVNDCPSCVWIAAWADWGYQDNGAFSLADGHKEAESGKVITQSEAVPGCFAKRFNDICSSDDVLNSSTSVSIYGRCLGGAKYDSKSKDYAAKTKDASDYNNAGCWSYVDMAGFLGTTVETAFSKKGTGSVTTGKINYSAQYQWYMDKDCKFVPNKADRPVCGFAGASWSPVSLIWEKGYEIGSDARVAEFNLTSSKDKRFSVWKASSKAPLLVFDPTHAATSVSAEQLFGNRAFGGVTDTPLVRSGSADWSNGYEALAILDANKDERISGDELSDISLWFDENQDARVDAGELKSIASHGVTALFFSEPKQLGTAKDLQIEVGYERVVDGVTTTGSSVDWYSEAFSSEQEAASALLAMADANPVGTSLVDNSYTPEEWMREPEKFTPNTPTNVKADIGGYWVWWQSKEKDGEKHPGAFAFRQGTDGVLRGFSLAEANLSANDEGLRSVVRAMPSLGKVEKLNEELSVSFDVLNEFGQPQGKSTARLSADGLHLTGTTKQTVEFMKDGKFQSTEVAYEWQATKVQPGNQQADDVQVDG
jgi:hypothetical protein